MPIIPTNSTQLNKIIANKLAVRENVSNRFLRSYESTLVSQYKIALNQIQKELSRLFDRFSEDPKNRLTEYTQFNRKKSLEKQIRKQLKELNAKNVKVFRKSIEGQFQDGYYSTQFAHETGMGLSFNFSQLPTDQIKAAVLNPVDAIKWGERSRDNINLLNKKVRESITQGIIKGESLQKVSRKLTDDLGIGFRKARTIVRTESHRAREMGNSLNYDKTQKSFEDLGITRDKVWLSTLDARTRPAHGSVDGKQANEDGLFEVFGVLAEAPGLTGLASQDINCRCTTISEVEGFSPQVRKDNVTKEIIPYKSFSKWAESRGLTKNVFGQKYLKVA